MPYYFRFLWNAQNIRHVAEHGISTEDFEYVVSNAKNSDVVKSHTSDRLTVIGKTAAGRLIKCVYEELDESLCFPVTAFDK